MKKGPQENGRRGFIKKLATISLAITTGVVGISDKVKAEIDKTKAQNPDKNKISLSEGTTNWATAEQHTEAYNTEGSFLEGGPDTVWGFSLDEIDKAGGPKAFFEANKDKIKAYADANGIKYNGNDKFLLIRFTTAANTAKSEREIAADKKEIAKSKEEIANSKENIAQMNKEMMNKIKERDKKTPKDVD